MTVVEFIVFLPLVAALAILLGAPARATAFATAGLNVLAAGWAVSRFDLGVTAVDSYQYQFTSSIPLLKNPELNLAFGIDGVSLVLVLLTVLVTLAAVWSSPVESRIHGNRKVYFMSLLLISGGALGAFCATDLFFFYAFHELALIPTFLMIGIFGLGQDRKLAAWTVTIYLGVGSLILLAGLLALFATVGGGATFDIAALRSLAQGEGAPSGEQQKWIYLTLLAGFGILASLFPFHTWAPPAYSRAPVPVAMLHAGVLKKFGLYGMIRIALPMLPGGAEHWQTLLLVLLVGNILIIGLATIGQTSLDRMLAYSSVMHMGYAFLGIAAGNIIGLNGVILMLFAHGLSIALLFSLAGRLRDRLGTLEFEKMGGGLAKAAPTMGLIFGFAAFASIGLPGFTNFAAEVLIFLGGFRPFLEDPAAGMRPLQWATVFALWGVVISAVYMLRAYRRIFHGPLGETGPVADLGWPEKLPMLILLAALLATGFVPSLLLKFLAPAMGGFLPPAG